MDTILFDLDGTLLPMNQDEFMRVYLPELGKKCAEVGGYDPNAIIEGVFVGLKAMVANDGSMTNEERFWEKFADRFGSKVLDVKDELELFYQREFHIAKKTCGENKMAGQLLQALRQAGYSVVLASNPVFPAGAYETRLSWIGLTPGDFDLVTSYEHYSYTKPNIGYYKQILEAIGKNPDDCLMVGNDVQEDGIAASLGMGVYIVTDNLINQNEADFSHLPCGSFEDLCGWAEQHLLKS